MRSLFLLLSAGMAMTAGISQAASPKLQRISGASPIDATLLNENIGMATRADSESSVPDADPKVLTYLSPDPFYPRLIASIPAQQNKVALLTRFNSLLLDRFKGNKATKITLVAPEEAIRVTVFVLDEKGENVFEKEITDLEDLPGCDCWGMGYLWGHEINVDVDFEITDKPFYVGYEVEVAPGAGVASIPLIVQEVPTTDVSFLDQFLGRGAQPYFGAPYLMIQTEGEGGLADYDAAMLTLDPMRVRVDQEFTEPGSFVNLGTKALTDILFDYTNPDGSKATYKLHSDEPYGYMSSISFAVPMNGNKVSSSVDCSLTITKLNDNSDKHEADNTMIANIISMDAELAPERTVLVEVATGTWCGYCPRSLQSVEYLPEYTKTKHIPIEIHVSDRFEGKNIDSYKPYVNACPGLPYAWVNRSISCDPWVGLSADPLAYGFGDVVEFAGNSLVELSMSLDAAYDPDAKEIRLEATTLPVIDLKDGERYRVGYALLENGLKGKQTNYYSSKAEYPYPQEYVPEAMMFWWEAEPEVDYTYNYTLRSLSDANGSEALAEGELKGSSEIKNSYTFDSSDVTNYSNSIAVAFVFDTLTGEIVNAAQAPIKNISGVGNVEADSVEYTLSGGVLALGEGSDVEVFDISGRRVLSANGVTGVDLTTLNGGVYLINISSMGKQKSIKIAL